MLALMMNFLVSLSETGYIFTQLTIDFIESILILMTISAKSAFNVWALVFGVITLFLTIFIKNNQYDETEQNQTENGKNEIISTEDLLLRVKEGCTSLESSMRSLSLPALERRSSLESAIRSH